MATAAAPERKLTKVLPFGRTVQIETVRLARPVPPRNPDFKSFTPDADAAEWIRETFLREGAPLENPDHQHLNFARLGVVWTHVENTRQQRIVLATCEMPSQQMSGAWKKARAEQQLQEWFGYSPDFLITLYSAIADFDDRSFCAVIEHELYHAAQDLKDGAPRFHRDGTPFFALRNHDIEEFFGVAARYGLRSELRALVDLAKQQPQIPDHMIEGVCGTCLARAA